MDLLELRRTALKGLQQEWIKVPARSVQHDLHGGGVSQGRLVGAAGANAVIHIGDGDDACGQGDVIAGEAIGVSLAVETLVVMAGDVDRHLQEGDGGTVSSWATFPCKDLRGRWSCASA